LRVFTAFISTAIGPGTRTPYSPARRAMCATCALATSALVGVQPSLTQVPPKCSRSMNATLRPAPVNREVNAEAAWPLPITMASKWGMALLSVAQPGRG